MLTEEVIAQGYSAGTRKLLTEEVKAQDYYCTSSITVHLSEEGIAQGKRTHMACVAATRAFGPGWAASNKAAQEPLGIHAKVSLH